MIQKIIKKGLGNDMSDYLWVYYLRNIPEEPEIRTILTSRERFEMFAFSIGSGITGNPYAIATTKYERDLFEKMRSPEYFVRKRMKISDLNDNGKRKIRNLQLHLVPLRTVNEFGVPTNLDVLMTWAEEEFVMLHYERLTTQLMGKVMPATKAFLPKSKKALTTVGYGNIPFRNLVQLSYPELIDFSKKSTKIDVDEFEVFMRLYGWMLK